MMNGPACPSRFDFPERLMFPFPLIRLIFAVTFLSIVSVLPTGIAEAQPPEDAGAENVDPENGGDVSADPTPISDTPLVRQTMDLARRKPETLPRAIRSMTRAGEWAAVDQLLRQAGEAKLDEAALAEISRQLGGALFVRLSGREELSEAAEAVLQQAAAADRAQRESPERLAQAIKQLGDRNVAPEDRGAIDRRLQASRTLLGGGEQAVVQMVGAIVGGEDDARIGTLTRLLARLGAGGGDLLLQYAIYAAPEQRARAMVALDLLKHPLATATALSSLHAAGSTDAERTAAANLLVDSSDSLPQRDAAVAALMRLLHRQQDIVDRQVAGESVTTAWVFEPATGDASSLMVDAKTEARRRAVDIGAMLRRIGDLPREAMTKIAINDLTYQVHVDPDWGDDDQVDAALTTYPHLGTTRGLLDFLEAAKRADRPAAVIAGLRILSDESAGVASPLLLTADQPAKSVLVELASSSIPRVRYEAATAIDALRTDRPYAGKSEVRRTIGEMATLVERPVAVLVETRPQVRGELGALLASLGYEVRYVGSTAGALRALASGGDIRLILAKTLLWDATPVEFVDRVRRTTLGRELPIVFFTDETSTPLDFDQIERPRWPGRTMVIPRPYTAGGLRPVIEQIDQDADLLPLSPAERQMFRRRAVTGAN